MPKSYYFVVVGCGRLGSKVAGYLSEKGHSVVVMDKNENAFERLPPEFTGFTVYGDATEMESLKEAKVNMADMVLAFTANDNTNFMVAQIALRIFGVPRVVAYVHEPENIELFKEFGIEVVCPTLLTFETMKGIFRFLEE